MGATKVAPFSLCGAPSIDGGVVRHLNAEAARQLKLQRHLAQGRRLGSLLDFDTMVEQVFLTGEGYTDRERIIATPRFQLHVLDTAIPVKAADGRVLSVVNTFREIQGLPPEAIERMDTDFREHWIGKPGAGGRKADWTLTYQTWARREGDKHRARQRDPPRQFNRDPYRSPLD